MKLRSRGVLAAPALLAVMAMASSASSPGLPWRSELVSANADGTDSANGPSTSAVLSPDGTKIAFASDASDLGPADTNGSSDVYVRDLDTGTTTLVSVNADGTGSGDSESNDPVFSPDGSKIAFVSDASDLGPADEHDGRDVYVRDLATETTTLVSTDLPDSTYVTESISPVFSPDGTKVAFGHGTTIVGLVMPAVYVRDLVEETTTLVSVRADGTADQFTSNQPVTFSPDGTKIAFMSVTSYFGPIDTHNGPDVYLRDLVEETTTLVSVDADGDAMGANFGSATRFSPDGTKIAFADNVVDNDTTDPSDDVYVRDLVGGTTTLVSGDLPDFSADYLLSTDPVFSPDGAKVAFRTVAIDGEHSDPAPAAVYVHDLAEGSTTLVSVDAEGSGRAEAQMTLVDAVYYNPRVVPLHFSPDGTRIAFSAAADDLVDVDTNLGHVDVYIRDLVHETTTLVTADRHSTSTGDGDSSLLFGFHPNGRRLLYGSSASNLGPADSERPETDPASDLDVYLAHCRGRTCRSLPDTPGEPPQP